MARFFALNLPVFLPAALASLLPGFPCLLAASTNAPPAKAGPPAAASNQPDTPAQDTLRRYGNILQPGVGPAHPLRLALPFPDIGEIKLPTQDEIISRKKLEALATLTDDQIRNQLGKWPPFTKMSLKDEAAFLSRIQDFRDHRAKLAQQEAHNIGLLTLTPEQKVRFEKEYWSKRLSMEQELAKQFEPILQQRQMQLNEELYREFSLPDGPLTQKPPKPSSPAKTASSRTNKPPAPSTSPTQVGANSSQPPMP